MSSHICNLDFTYRIYIIIGYNLREKNMSSQKHPSSSCHVYYIFTEGLSIISFEHFFFFLISKYVINKNIVNDVVVVVFILNRVIYVLSLLYPLYQLVLLEVRKSISMRSIRYVFGSSVFFFFLHYSGR